MSDQHTVESSEWVDASTQAAPLLIGAAAGLLLGDMMHPNARRGLGIGLGALAIAALLPAVVGGVTQLVVGPKSKLGVRRRIQHIRDAGICGDGYDPVDEELREQGLI